MKPNIDSEKIVRHIKYTRHWLDKATDEIGQKKFASGGAVLALAKAEIASALEEALMLKSRVVSKLPARRPSVKMGVASSVSLLASGFIIAVLVIQFTTNPIPRPGGIGQIDSVTTAPVVVDPTPAVKTASPAAERVKSTVAPASVPKIIAAPRRIIRALRRPARAAAVETAPAPVAAPVSAATPEPAAVPVVEAPKPAPTLNQSDIIDMYKAAKQALSQ